MRPMPKLHDSVQAHTIKAEDGRILLFSCEQFVEDICVGSCCFICGARPGTKTFNNEHVIPRWVLNRFGLFDKQINLPNGQQHTYGTYRVPCCEDCNTLMSRDLETPISQLLDGGYATVVKKLNAEIVFKLFVWICLIFVKIHMKDRLLREHLDRRQPGMIADDYFWPGLHHLHAVARSCLTQADFDPGVLGSFICLPMDDPTVSEGFDWVDMTDAQTIALRIDDLGIVCVLNDAGAARIGLADTIGAIKCPLTTTQLRELAARMAVANSDLENRPEFGTIVSSGPPRRVLLWARHDAAPRFTEFSIESYGNALAFSLNDRLEHLVVNGQRGADRVREMLLTGRVSFLFDANGVNVREIA